MIALQELWGGVRALPDGDAPLNALTPLERRDAHDLACRIADRIADTSARLVRDMATDGADLVDATGLPAAMKRPLDQSDGQVE